MAFFPTDPGFRRLEFNPYLIPVVLLAVRFGTLVGGSAGLLCALWLVGSSRHGDLEDGSLVLPGLLIGVGLLAGALSRHQGERLAFYRWRTRVLQGEQVRAAQLLEARASVIRELQSRIEEQTVSIGGLYRIGRAMTSDDPREMSDSLLRLLSSDLKVTRAAVYQPVDGELRLAASIDHGLQPRPFSATLDPDAGLPGLALKLGRRVSIFEHEAAGLDLRRTEPAMISGLVRSGEDLKAVIVVHELPLFEFTPSAVSKFDALLEWASEARGPAEIVETSDEPPYFDRRIGAYRWVYVQETLQRELQRARRHALPLRVLQVKLTALDDVPAPARESVRQRVARILFAYMRECDTVGLGPSEDTFLAILPMCEASSAQAFRFRINAMLEKIVGAMSYSFEFVDPETLEIADGDPAVPLVVPA